LQNNEDFEGKAADCIKTYWGEAIVAAAEGFAAAFNELETRYGLYAESYADGEIDSCKTAHLNSDAITDAAQNMNDLGDDFSNYGQQAESILDEAIPLVGGSLPSASDASGTLKKASEDASILDTQMDVHESTFVDEAKSLSNLLDELDSLLGTLGSYGGGSEYVQGGIMIDNPEAINAVIGSMHYTDDHSADASKAFGDIQEADRELAANRENDADDKLMNGADNIAKGIAIIGGVVLIVASGGTATPLVIGACVAGGFELGFGASKTVEGVNEYNLATSGDGLSEAYNPLRDWAFDGIFGEDNDPYEESASDEAYSIVDKGVGIAGDVMEGVVGAASSLFAAPSGGSKMLQGLQGWIDNKVGVDGMGEGITSAGEGVAIDGFNDWLSHIISPHDTEESDEIDTDLSALNGGIDVLKDLEKIEE
jgi:hypothetical protein